MPTIPGDPGGGSSTAYGTDDSAELSSGGYCGFAGVTGASEYCIYAKPSDGNWIIASENGMSTIASYPVTVSACP